MIYARALGERLHGAHADDERVVVLGEDIGDPLLGEPSSPRALVAGVRGGDLDVTRHTWGLRRVRSETGALLTPHAASLGKSGCVFCGVKI